MSREDTTCAICGSHETRPVFRRGLGGEALTWVICQRCGFMFLLAAEATAGGTVAAEGMEQKDISPQGIAFSETLAWERYDRLRAAGDPTVPSVCEELLEIGCGIGSFLRLMRGAGYEVLGLESDAASTKMGKNLYDLPIQVGDYEKVNLGQARFDMIASFHVLEHTRSPRLFIDKVYKELKMGGGLYLEASCIEHPIDGDPDNFLWSANRSIFSKKTLSGLLSQAGFRITQSGYAGYSLWILAEKVKLESGLLPRYPFDDPQEVQQHTQQLHEQLLSKSNTRVDASDLRAPGLLQRVTKKILHDPGDVLPAFGRKFRDLSNNKAPLLIRRLSDNLLNRPRLAHVGLHSPGNAGDTLLFPAVRRIIEEVNGPYRWSLENLWDEMTDQTMQRLNDSTKGIVIGGGGILLRDTRPNQRSGWQWNCSIENMRKIEVPIVVFAIGYNRFRDQEDFNDFFRPHINELVQKSVFFGLRNHGSIRNLSQYLDAETAGRLAYQPCPTTLLRYLYPRYLRASGSDRPRKLALNVAFDRHELRFDHRENEILTSLACVMKRATLDGWEIHLAIHIPDDMTIIPWLVREKVEFSTVRLDGRPHEDILEFYSGISLAIGMRGHSQMIPFGLGKSIISIISHDKLKYFLEDIEHPEWGVDIKDLMLEDKLVEKIREFGSDSDCIEAQILEAQEKLWDVSKQNLREIKGKIGA